MKYRYSALTVIVAIMFSMTLCTASAQQTKRFSLLSWNQTIRDVFYLDGEERMPLTIPNGAPSPVYELSGVEGPLIFYRDGGLGPDGALVNVPVAQATWQPGGLLRCYYFLSVMVGRGSIIW
ncbi:hypothetical protein SH580_17305 [Coraliomargarita algicola]|uniref:Uncharacterized protein n=1 Tax=Coraliomargarita algicola TaxID=3092156 RepID=A0ABZ0RJT1_9BACT|nr:hypothetical protein [Coraliomargarita sp. J2-16]WPJ95182.1 hypothetical protein SH580_17305 [Coraliomargarita sp. J2-16]